MNEPDNHTAVVDRYGDTWVRCDDMPGRYGPWWPCTDGPRWDAGAADPGVPHGWAEICAVGIPRRWAEVEEYGPFVAADPDRTAAAIDRVRRAVAP